MTTLLLRRAFFSRLGSVAREKTLKLPFIIERSTSAITTRAITNQILSSGESSSSISRCAKRLTKTVKWRHRWQVSELQETNDNQMMSAVGKLSVALLRCSGVDATFSGVQNMPFDSSPDIANFT